MNNMTELSYENEFYFQWHITDLCNFRCKHCYHEDYREKGLSISNVLKIGAHLCDALKEWGKVGSFSITGGEPFMRRKAVFDLLNFFENRNEVGYADILSNGSLINKEIIKRLRDYKKLRRIQLSLEGPKEINDQIRGTGSYDAIIDTIKKIRDHGLSTSVMITIGKHNSKTVIPLIEKLGQIGVETIVLDRFVPEGQSSGLGEWVLKADQLRKVYEKCYSYFLSNLKPRLLLYRTLFCLLNPEDEHIGAVCSAGNNALTIMPNGDVFPCRRLPIKIGNLLQTTVFDIWYTNPLLWELRNPDNFKGKCRTCEYIPICRGCRAVAYSMTGDYLQSDPQCWKK